jgi:hypothetical protein
MSSAVVVPRRTHITRQDKNARIQGGEYQQVLSMNALERSGSGERNTDADEENERSSMKMRSRKRTRGSAKGR